MILLLTSCHFFDIMFVRPLSIIKEHYMDESKYHEASLQVPKTALHFLPLPFLQSICLGKGHLLIKRLSFHFLFPLLLYYLFTHPSAATVGSHDGVGPPSFCK